MREMGFSAPRYPCPTCPAGKAKRAASKSAESPKPTKIFVRVNFDVKVSSVVGEGGICYVGGFVDAATNSAMTYDMAGLTTDDHIKAVDAYLTNVVRDGKLIELRVDNHPSMVSTKFSDHCVSRGIRLSYSASYHTRDKMGWPKACGVG
jgi:hypothetical protein